MNRQEFIAALSEKIGTTKKDAKIIVDSTFDLITETLASGDSVNIYGFGNFEVDEVPETMRYNPQTGEKFMAPAKRRPKFKALKGLKDAVNA